MGKDDLAKACCTSISPGMRLLNWPVIGVVMSALAPLLMANKAVTTIDDFMMD